MKLQLQMWTKLCENCDIYKDKPCMCCIRELKRHDRRKKASVSSNAGVLSFARQRSVNTRMDKKTIDEIWLQVKENHRKLDGCRIHDFSIDLNPERPMGKKYQCTRCGGWVDVTGKTWYEKGLQHQAAAQEQKGCD